MKINGSSKIISEKEEQETLVSRAEASDLLGTEVIEHNQSKVQQVKKMAQDMFEKTKPFREKQKQLTEVAIKKARGMSPYVDKSITAMDVAIDYITKPHHIEGRSEVVQETRAPAIFGVWVLIITFGIGMVWAMVAPLDSASHAMVGKIILESKKRIIQSPDYGGVIKEILVRDGDQVKKGQTLLILDDTQIRARKNQYEYKYLSSLAEVTRLMAERDDLQELTFPDELASRANEIEIKEMMHNQEKVFAAKKAAISSKIAHTEKNILQYTEQKNALLPQIEAVEKLIKISTDQVDTYKKLLAKGNLNKAYLQDAQSRKAENEGRKGQLVSQLAGTEQAILQSELELENFKHQKFEETVSNLKQNQIELAINSEAFKDANENLKRTVIVAPEDGNISSDFKLVKKNSTDGNISSLNDKLTPQGIIPPHETLMEVIPQDDKLIVEAKISAADIAAVKVGQVSRVRLTAYRARVVPILLGKVTSLSADVSIPDPREMQMGMQPYYKARIEIDKEELDAVAELKDVSLYPGMGVDVMIVIGTRTLMKYIMDPITMTLDHAFREK